MEWIGRDATPDHSTIQRHVINATIESIDLETFSVKLTKKILAENIISFEKVSADAVLAVDGTGLSTTHGGDWRIYKHGDKKAFGRFSHRMLLLKQVEESYWLLSTKHPSWYLVNVVMKNGIGYREQGPSNPAINIIIPSSGGNSGIGSSLTGLNLSGTALSDCSINSTYTNVGTNTKKMIIDMLAIVRTI